MNALLPLLIERRRGGLAYFLARTFARGLRRSEGRRDPAAVQRGWRRQAWHWWGVWQAGGCRGR